jgi:triosephosphate isomerase (TIM)
VSSVSDTAKVIGRQVIVAGNWKMNKTRKEARELTEAIKKGLPDSADLPEVVLIPPYTALAEVESLVKGSKLKLGAQNMDYRDSGAFTGEISPLMLKELGVQYVLIGHSERRQYFGETNATTHLRLKAAFAHGLLPILCVGESLDEREAQLTDAVVNRQVGAAVAEIDKSHLAKLVVAYEPVWAIGTGKHCEAQEANRVAKIIRHTLQSLFSKAGAKDADADRVPILYGGSVNAGNVDKQLDTQIEEIDGVLVGGASLKADEFLTLIRAAEKRKVSLKSAAVR